MKKIKQLIAFLLVNAFCITIYAQVSTPNGTSVEYFVPTYNSADAALAESNASNWLAARGWTNDVIKTAPATNVYNCHSYAWNMSEGGMACWVNAFLNTELNNYLYYYVPTPAPKNIQKYWNDGSYIEVPESNATKVWYGSCWLGGGNECDHSAVRITSGTHAGKYESKWGAWPRYIHPANRSPYNINNRKYYKKAPVTIIGSSTVCPNATYTLSNGQPAEWSISNKYFSLVTSNNGTTATVRAHSQAFSSSQSATLTAKVGLQTLTKSIHACGQAIMGPDIIFPSSDPFCTEFGLGSSYSLYPFIHNQPVAWSVSNGFNISSALVTPVTYNGQTGTITATTSGIYANNRNITASKSWGSYVWTSMYLYSYGYPNLDATYFLEATAPGINQHLYESLSIKPFDYQGIDEIITEISVDETFSPYLVVLNPRDHNVYNMSYYIDVRAYDLSDYSEIYYHEYAGVTTNDPGSVSLYESNNVGIPAYPGSRYFMIIEIWVAQPNQSARTVAESHRMSRNDLRSAKIDEIIKKLNSQEETSANLGVSAYPNSTSDILNIDIAAFAVQSLSLQSAVPTYDIRLYNGQGILLRQTSTQDNKAVFNVANLPAGIYFLRIYDGVSDKPITRKIQIKH